MWDKLVKIYQLSMRAFGGHKKSILFLTFLGLLNAGLAGIGINTLIPIFSLVSGKSDVLGTDVITGYIESFFVFFGIDFRLKYLLLFIGALFIVQSVVLLFSNYFIARITADYERRTRELLFAKTVRADWPYLLKQKVGYLEMVIANDIKYGAVVLTGISGLVITVMSLLIYILVAINISFTVTAMAFVLGLAYVVCTKPILVRIKKTGLKISALYKDMSHFINESIFGMKTMKVFSAEPAVADIARKKFATLRDLRVRVALLGALGGAVIQPMSVVFIVAIFAVFYTSGAFHIGSFLALIYLIQKIFSYFSQMQSTLQKAIESAPYLQNVLAYEDAAREFTEHIGGGKHFVSGSSLSFDRVSFSYDESKNILEDVSFRLEKGEMVGLIGPSGAGKTTIVDLLLRLFQPTAGKILLGRVDSEEIDMKEWREKIGYVSQDMFLMNDTIENNIRFYDDRLSLPDIELACRQANIHDFIMSRPAAFQTAVGERGNLLSVGQRQRIAIARVLARKPEMLILDEATSALDNESEAAIQRVIDSLRGNATVLIIAHRLSTVMSCDRLLALDRGRIVEEGKPEALLKNTDSYFYRVYHIEEKGKASSA